MAPTARIIGLSLLTGGLVAGLGLAFFGQYYIILCLFLGGIGAIVGAVAGASREIVAALRQRPSS